MSYLEIIKDLEERDTTPPTCIAVPIAAHGRVTWESPLFGLLTGDVISVLDNGSVEVFHPLTERLATIPVMWLRREGHDHGHDFEESG